VGKEATSVAMPVKPRERERGEETFEQKLARLRATPEERAEVLASGSPFDYEAWVRQVGPAIPEELAETEEVLREREAERRRSLTHEAKGWWTAVGMFAGGASNTPAACATHGRPGARWG
jgi:hypothetical protein